MGYIMVVLIPREFSRGRSSWFLQIVLTRKGLHPNGKTVAIFSFPYDNDPRLSFQEERGFFIGKDSRMETRIALIGIIVENPDTTGELNKILHEYADCIVGRMGIPYKQKGVCIISVVVDAPQNAISSLCGKLGMLDGLSVKAVYSKQYTSPEGA